MTETAKIKIYAQDLEQTQQIATELAHLVSAGTIMLLNGNLGAGKTTFMQFFGLALGITTNITSPTFTLIDEYTDGRLPLYHVDLYRLEPLQVDSLYLSEYWQGVDFPLGIVAIEWASRLPSLPSSYLQIDLRSPIPKVPDNPDSLLLEEDISISGDRWLEFTAHGSGYVRVIDELAVSLHSLNLLLEN